MTEKIEPALTAAEWPDVHAAVQGYRAANRGMFPGHAFAGSDMTPAKAIAMNNALLPDDDPRKLTRERIMLLRVAYGLSVGNMGGDESKDAIALDEFIEALESYLPPEAPQQSTNPFGPRVLP